ncbi:MAG TPA: DDE-type integrase/transposase/recombinase [Accumulibacter sp.]|nr:DDE-type integrase/transposase/recombinase [Accumulibacter sp.]
MLAMPPSATQLPHVLMLAAELPGLPHGHGTPRVRSIAEHLGISVQTLWKWVKEAGYASDRKRRSDAGKLKAVSEEQVRRMAAIRFAGARETGKVLPTLEMARDIANANAPVDPATGEVAVTTAHASTISRAMKRIGCHSEQLLRASAAQPMKSLHPNHVWQCDVSTCVLFYLANGGMEICDTAAFNKNKPANFARVQELRVQRYLVVDHCSGAFYLQYLPGHETAQNLLDFLIPAFHPRDGQPFYGVPKMLLVDPGSAQASGLVRSLTRALEIDVRVHTAGNPRAKGAVESLHNHIERQFEGRLQAQRVRDFAQLNELAGLWSAAYQTTAIHGRTGRTRFSGWQEIARYPGALRLAPGPEITRALVMSEPTKRVVDQLLRISFAIPGHGQHFYSVAGIPGAAFKEKLFVVASPYHLPDIDVLAHDAEGREVRHRRSPLVEDEWGYQKDAATFGEEYQRPADSHLDVERKRARRAAWGSDDEAEIAKKRRGVAGKRGVAFDGAVDAFADVRQTPVPMYLPLAGTAIEAAVPLQESVMSATAACLRMHALLGDAWQPEHYAWITKRFSGGISEAQFAQLAEQWRGVALTPGLSPGGREGVSAFPLPPGEGSRVRDEEERKAC